MENKATIKIGSDIARAEWKSEVGDEMEAKTHKRHAEGRSGGGGEPYGNEKGRKVIAILYTYLCVLYRQSDPLPPVSTQLTAKLSASNKPANFHPALSIFPVNTRRSRRALQTAEATCTRQHSASASSLSLSAGTHHDDDPSSPQKLE